MKIKKRVINKTKLTSKRWQIQNGITLIALVVTIVVLLILSGVAINLVLGDNGIITKAKEAKEKQEVAEIIDKLELAKVPIAIDNENNLSIEDYLDYIQGEGKIDRNLSQIERVNQDNCYITIDNKYEFLLEHEDNGNLKIIYQGKIEKLVPRIINVELTNTSNSIQAKVEAKRTEKYNFYIKEDIDEEYILMEENNKTGEKIYSGLSQNKTYYLKIEAVNDNGKAQIEVTRTTSQIIELVEAEVESNIEPKVWTNGNVKTTIKINTNKDIKNYRIQYSQTDKELTTEELKNVKWKEYTNEGIISTKNEIIYTRLYDGTNATSYMSRKITIIDKIKPVINDMSVTTNSITISGTDDLSGIVGYVVSTSNTEPKTFSKSNNTKTFSKKEEGLMQNTTYYVWLKDEAGNISLSSSIKTLSVTDAVTEGAITFSGITWDATTHKASVTLSTNTSYKIKYQVNGYSGIWTEGKNVTGLNLNDTVYACLSDGTNNGNYTSLKITENEEPSVRLGEATGTGTSSTCSFTTGIEVTLTDRGSGVNTTNSKYIWNDSNEQVGTTSTLWDSATSIGKTSKTITKSLTSEGTWYLHVLGVDNAGNKVEIISKAVKVVANIHTHTSSCYHTHSSSCGTHTEYHRDKNGDIYVCGYHPYYGSKDLCSGWTAYNCGKNTNTPYCGKGTTYTMSYT